MKDLKNKNRTRFFYGLLILCLFGILSSIPVSAASKKPAKVTKVKISSVKTNSMKVKWAKAKNAKSYEVACRKSSEKTWKLKTTKKTSLTLKKLDSSTKYKIRVRGRNGSKVGKWSSTVTKTTKTPPAPPAPVDAPAAPKALWPTHLDETSISVMWYKVTDATGYEAVCMKGSSVVSTVTTENNSAVFSSLEAGTDYQIRIYAVSGSQKSADSTNLDTFTLLNNEMKVEGEYVPLSCSITRYTVGKDEKVLPRLYDQDTDGMHYYYPSASLQEITIQSGHMIMYTPPGSPEGILGEQDITAETTYKVGDTFTDPQGNSVKIETLLLFGYNEYESHDTWQLEINGHIRIEW